MKIKLDFKCSADNRPRIVTRALENRGFGSRLKVDRRLRFTAESRASSLFSLHEPRPLFSPQRQLLIVNTG